MDTRTVNTQRALFEQGPFWFRAKPPHPGPLPQRGEGAKHYPPLPSWEGLGEGGLLGCQCKVQGTEQLLRNRL